MKKEDIQFWDLARWFVGDVPGSFYIELVIRGVVVYLILIVSMRLLGKRMSAQLSRNEIAAMSCLAAAIGIPIQSPERGLLPMFVIAIVVIWIGRTIAKYSYKSQKFEYISQGNLDILVQDSMMYLDRMKQVRISRDQLCAQLRSSSIRHLGEVKRLYIEANGNFTLIKNDEPEPGLSVLPQWDKEFVEQVLRPTNTKVCKSCGNKQEATNKENGCSNCGNKDWVTAVL